MTVPETPDLPVIWWLFWLAVMAVGVFVALVAWLGREARAADSATSRGHRPSPADQPGSPRQQAPPDAAGDAAAEAGRHDADPR